MIIVGLRLRDHDYGFTTTCEAVLVVPTSSFLSSLGVSSLSLCSTCTESFWDL